MRVKRGRRRPSAGPGRAIMADMVKPAIPTAGRNDLLPAAAPSFDDPLGMLLACHGRMRRQLGTLARLSRYVTENGADDEARAAASAILRYFDRAAVDHHADEDASLVPRLSATAPELNGVLGRLTEEHRELALRWRKLRPLLASIAAGRNEALPPALVREVCEGYEAHLAREEMLVIPRAREALAPELIAEMGREFAARRGH